jgi:hypothetical protein
MDMIGMDGYVGSGIAFSQGVKEGSLGVTYIYYCCYYLHAALLSSDDARC